MMQLLALAIVVSFAGAGAHADTLVERYPTPSGWTRANDVEAHGTFAAFLSKLPLAPPETPVRSYDGVVLHHRYAGAVFELDVGRQDLQQCADSALRLWAEFVRSEHGSQLSKLHFHATNGDDMPFHRYQANERLRVTKAGRLAAGAAAFASADERWRTYLNDVFTYAGSRSLALDTTRADTVQAGDVLVEPGSPGHVVVVLDVATDANGRARYLVGQGFMPAQSFHVVVDDDGSPWWLAVDGQLRLPSWPRPFALSSARRFSLPLPASGGTTTKAGR